MSVKRITLALLALVILTGFVTIGAMDAVKTKDSLQFQEIEIKSKSSDLKQLDVKYDQLNKDLDNAAKQKDINQADIDKLQQEKQDLEKQKQDLESQLQAKIDKKNELAVAASKVATTVTGTQTAYAAALDTTIDCNNQTSAKAFVYCHESGNNPASGNSGGCYGLGQDCNGIVRNKCGADYACQDEFFTDYMTRRYGSWEAAKAFWLARTPINGIDRGNWW